MAGSRLGPIKVPEGFWHRNDVAQALCSRDFATLFSLLRDQAGASQTQIGAATGIAQTRISEVMRRMRRLESIDVLHRVADGLDFPDSARLMIGIAPNDAIFPHLPPTTDNGTTATTAASSVQVAQEEPDTETDDAISFLSLARDRYERMYRQVGGVAIRPRIQQFVHDRVAPLLAARHDENSRRVVLRAAGGLIALVGICSYDAEEQETARQNFIQALQLARAGGEPAFIGYVSGLLVNQALRAGRYGEAVNLAEASLQEGKGQLTPALTTDLLCSQAEAYARMNDRRNTLTRLKLIEDVSSRIRLAEEPPEARHVQPGVVEGRQGEALRQLGDLEQATIYAQRSSELGTAIHPRGRANRLIGEMNLLLSQRKPDEAAVIGLGLVDLTEGMESRLIRKRLYTIRNDMRVFEPSASVRAFCECAEEILRAPM
jgi:transcriptional regulator with XRE-family HTH domain